VAAPVACETVVAVPTRLVVVRGAFDLGGPERGEIEQDSLFAARVDRREHAESHEMLQAPFAPFRSGQMLATVT
jgi:hypothetical protein